MSACTRPGRAAVRRRRCASHDRRARCGRVDGDSRSRRNYPFGPQCFAMNSLTGLRVLDLSRVLAGPWSTQTLADLGADVIKIERPGSGDDTRSWGPPFLQDDAGRDTHEAAYYLGTNRNKRSITCDIAQPAGQQ